MVWLVWNYLSIPLIVLLWQPTTVILDNPLHCTKLNATYHPLGERHVLAVLWLVHAVYEAPSLLSPFVDNWKYVPLYPVSSTTRQRVDVCRHIANFLCSNYNSQLNANEDNTKWSQPLHKQVAPLHRVLAWCNSIVRSATIISRRHWPRGVVLIVFECQMSKEMSM